MIVQKFAQELQSNRFVPSSLHRKVKHHAFVIKSGPQIPALSLDAADHFVEAPARRWILSPPLQMNGDLRAELVHPDRDSLIGDIDGSPRQISSTSRRFGVNRKWRKTACRMTAGGNRCPILGNAWHCRSNPAGRLTSPQSKVSARLTAPHAVCERVGCSRRPRAAKTGGTVHGRAL